MKRKANVIPQIVTIENLYRAYAKAKKAKMHRPEVIAFAQNLQQNLLALRRDILEETVHFGNYHYFTIYDPKERLICASSFQLPCIKP